MKGHVPTPPDLAARIVEKLFRNRPPEAGDRILYPGFGTGPFATSVLEYCAARALPVPNGVAIENDPNLVEEALVIHAGGNVDVLERDFLGDLTDLGEFQYVVGNPPYVPIEGLSAAEKADYREKFRTAKGRFDLFILFFEQALRLLKSGGRLVFITPEKFEYTITAQPLRKILASEFHLLEIDHMDEGAFEGLTTYPTITTVDRKAPAETVVRLRDGTDRVVKLPSDGSSWASVLRGGSTLGKKHTLALEDVCRRISCGVATGADKVFVRPAQEVPKTVRNRTYPTISGRQMSVRDGVKPTDLIICPYDADGSLASVEDLGGFVDWARLHEKRLRQRTCVQDGGKAWYAWHETPPLMELMQPKILCQDLAQEPRFWADEAGTVVPRHSVYYIVPNRKEWIDPLLSYLNGADARAWITANAQRAANGSIRLQSTVLKRLPVPDDVVKVETSQVPPR